MADDLERMLRDSLDKRATGFAPAGSGQGLEAMLVARVGRRLRARRVTATLVTSAASLALLMLAFLQSPGPPATNAGPGYSVATSPAQPSTSTSAAQASPTSIIEASAGGQPSTTRPTATIGSTAPLPVLASKSTPPAGTTTTVPVPSSTSTTTIVVVTVTSTTPPTTTPSTTTPPTSVITEVLIFTTASSGKTVRVHQGDKIELALRQPCGSATWNQPTSSAPGVLQPQPAPPVTEIGDTMAAFLAASPGQGLLLATSGPSVCPSAAGSFTLRVKVRP